MPRAPPAGLPLLLFFRRGQLKRGGRLAAPLFGFGFEALYGLVGHVATAEGGGMDAGTVKVGAAGRNQVVLVGECKQGLLVLLSVGAVVGFQADQADSAQAWKPVAQLFQAR